jgi:hypothetical protein
VRNNVVLFGGISDNWIIQNTWTWDGVDWTLLNPKTQPPPLYFSTGAFNPVTNKVLVFGGGSEGVDQNTTWTWDGRTWRLLSPSVSPPAREGFGTVWDAAHRQFLIFDGSVFSSGRVFSDMWKLTGE